MADETTAEYDPDDPVWADVWNPNLNQWDPNSEPIGGDAGAWMPHGDVMVAEPMTEQYGGEPSGTVPPAGMNLLTDVRDPGSIPAPAVQVIQHEVHSQAAGAELVRGRTVAVVGNLTPTRLLDENPQRTRALIKLVTSNAVVLIGASFGPMGAPQLTANPTQPVGAFPQATGDPMLEVKSQAAVDAIGVTASGTVLVAIWEELTSLSSAPGLVN